MAKLFLLETGFLWNNWGKLTRNETLDSVWRDTILPRSLKSHTSYIRPQKSKADSTVLYFCCWNNTCINISCSFRLKKTFSLPLVLILLSNAFDDKFVILMSVLSRLDLCYSFCSCLLTVSLLWWQVSARAQVADATFPPFPLFPFLNLSTFPRGKALKVRRGPGENGIGVFPIMQSLRGLRYNLSLFTQNSYILKI